METRANYVLIGLFTLAVLVGAFGFVYWFHHVGGTTVRNYYRVVFQGPIGGLRTGAPVSFNGIRVGDVVDLGLDPNDPRQALVTISVASGTPLRSDTRASLEFQGLTGIATLSLRGGSPDAAPVPRKDNELPTLTAGSSASQDVMQAARDTLSRIDGIIIENQASLKNSLRNIETFTQALARNTERIDRIIAGVDTMVGGPEGKGDIPDAVRAIKSTAENLDKKLDGLVTDGRRTLGVIERTVRNFDENPTRLIFGGGKPANRR
ncbi:MAG: MCE family protein [Pseudorhodoplanes sp.]|nr:hypothetical protein [Pseudorhodoplanes sp.]MCL4710604.1 MCE family protein [Pseudorhodoplanes sp.]MCQ3943864.1 MCE family protein [Alphaproteobacteria bacterium]GIK79257.1 MAG: ABC transporter [Alphaproteobacteria bacterium]